MTTVPNRITPGSTIGILGGGQLGQMLAMAATRLGYQCHIFAPEADSIAAHSAASFTCAPWHDSAAMTRFAAQCSVITYEFENVPVDALEPVDKALLAPHPRALEIAQDRLTEKQFAIDAGGRPAPHAPVRTQADLRAAITEIGAPGVLKTRRNGYDGKGQWRIGDATDIAALGLPDAPLIYERFIDFTGEFSVICCREANGHVVFWDTPRNVHEDGILKTSSIPATGIAPAQIEEARRLAAQIAGALDYIGVLTCEFFATPDGPVFNEMAPRVHNSGHWTIEGAVTSQFENHIRAICGLPLGRTDCVSPRIEMRNLIGEEARTWPDLLADPDNHLHLYGKAEIRLGRKMGHVTRVFLD